MACGSSWKSLRIDDYIQPSSIKTSLNTSLVETSQDSDNRGSACDSSLGIMDLHGEYLEQFEKLQIDVKKLEKDLEEYLDNYKPLNEETYKSIDNEYKEWHGGIRGRLQKLLVDIEDMNVTIFLAGECDSGKSTLLHALLDIEIEPSPTRISCRYTFGHYSRVEFRQSQIYRNSIRKKYHVKKEDVISLHDDENEENTHTLIKDRTSAISVPQKIYDEAVFYVRSTILKDKVFIVDLPGVKDPLPASRKTLCQNPSNKMAIQCIKNESNAFIFVLNATKIEEETLAAENVIRAAYEKLKGTGSPHLRDHRVILKNVLFVFNKWDLVTREGREYAENQKTLAKRKIHDLWPEINPDLQIYFLSAAEVLNKRETGDPIPGKFRDFKQSIKRLVKHILDSNIENHIRFLQYLFQKMETATYEKIRSTLDIYFNREREQKTIQEDQRKLHAQNVPNFAKLIMEDFDQYFEITTLSLLEHLKSDVPQDRLMRMDLRGKNDLDSMKKITMFIHQTIQQNIQREINHWDCQTRLLTNLSNFFNDCFQSRIEVFGPDFIPMKMLTTEQIMRLISDQGHKSRSDTSHLDTAVQTLIVGMGIVAQIPFHAVGTLVSIPVLAILFHDFNKKEKEMVQLFHEDPETFVKTRISRYLRRRLTEEILKTSYLDRLHIEYEKQANTLQCFIQKLIESRNRRLENHRNESRSMKEVIETFHPHLDKIRELYSSLHIINIKYRSEICCETIQSPITDQYFHDNQPFCQGTFAEYYHYEKKYCLRKLKQRLDQTNARRYLSELYTLQNMRYHEGGGDFLHFCCLVSYGEPDRLIYMVESFDGSLRTYLNENPHLLPVNVFQEDQFRNSLKFVLNLSYQLANSLVLLENFKWGIVHPDLRMENILIKKQEDGSIKLKLCDFSDENISPPPSEIPDIYIAPEHRCRIRQSGTRNIFRVCTASNIYSCGIFMWELYHAALVTDLTPIINGLTFSTQKTLRFPDTERCPKKFSTLISNCVNDSPEERPLAINVVPKLVEINNDNFSF